MYILVLNLVLFLNTLLIFFIRNFICCITDVGKTSSLTFLIFCSLKYAFYLSKYVMHNNCVVELLL